MWISELAERSGVPVATVKYYLREGLLPAGESTGATRAVYSPDHVRRLRLIRALVDVAGLRLSDVRRVLDAVDDDSTSLHDALGAAQASLAPSGAEPTEHSRSRVAALVRRRRWRISQESPNVAVLARALDALDDTGESLGEEALRGYAEAMGRLAGLEVSTIDAGSRENAVRQTVIRTLLIEPVLLTLRRMAHEHASQRAYGRRR